MKPWESPYSTFSNNPIFLADPFGDNVDSNRTKGMNFVIIPSKGARQEDIDQPDHGKIGSAYNVDAAVFKRMSKRSGGELQVIEADCASDAIAEIKKRLGSDGYVENIIIDYHKRAPDNVEGAFTDNSGNLNQGAKNAFRELAKGYAGVNTKVYMGQSWAGGFHNMTDGNITEETSDLLDGATVYGHQAAASSFSLVVSKSFVGWMFQEYGTNAADKARRGYHTVSFFHPKLNKVVSVEIKDKVKIQSNGAIHSHVNDIKSLPATRIGPTTIFTAPMPALPEEIPPPPPEN